MSPQDRKLWEYFATLYKNSNKGIKGRGKDRRISPTFKSGPGKRHQTLGNNDDKLQRPSYEESSVYTGGSSSDDEDVDTYYIDRQNHWAAVVFMFDPISTCSSLAVCCNVFEIFYDTRFVYVGCLWEFLRRRGSVVRQLTQKAFCAILLVSSNSWYKNVGSVISALLVGEYLTRRHGAVSELRVLGMPRPSSADQ